MLISPFCAPLSRGDRSQSSGKLVTRRSKTPTSRYAVSALVVGLGACRASLEHQSGGDRMMKMLLIALSAAALAAAAPCVTQGQSNVAKPAAKPAPSKSGHLAANGLNYYYEIHGTGEPLLLLHGGLGSIDMFRPVLLPALADGRRVIAVDLHGHGRTALGDRQIDLPDMGDDMAGGGKKHC